MDDITIGSTMSGKEVKLLASMGCRHGLITGATGTGKTTTLRLLAEGFAQMGSQVIITDIKGDVSGIVGALDNVHIYDVYGKCGTRFPIMLQDLKTDVISRLLDKMFQLPECGELEAPKAVIFFDEAHLLFRNTSKQVIERIEQTVKLIRSKGVGVYFISQNPKDIPDAVLAQLGNRIQHGLRAYTPNEWKGLRTASSSFRPNPRFDTMETIQKLGIGEALVSCLDEHGVPQVVEKVKVTAPVSGFGALSKGLFPIYRDKELEMQISNANKPVTTSGSEVQKTWKEKWWGKTLIISWKILKTALKIALLVLAVLLVAEKKSRKKTYNFKY